ncbi:MAG TPA: SGNH/GDSL hydrolase family protein [Bacteroidales bacterium]|nr:SGNH/GDSL hydrolase family protein [Bacteroidales bacterium]
MKNTDSRRNFLKKAALGTLAAVSIPEIITASVPKKKKAAINLQNGQTILFQGDSITDAGRNREDMGFNSPRPLGTGYAFLTAAQILEKYAGFNLKIYNKGISGNKVYQLAERWDKDCLELKPDILSILIGVNDFWHKFNGNYDGTVAIYRNDLIALVERTLKALPDLKLIICEPYAVPGVKAVNEKWYPEFPEYQKAAKEISEKFGAVFVPFQKVYDEAIKRAPASYWTGDGVHAALPGAQLMAKAWLAATGIDG